MIIQWFGLGNFSISGKMGGDDVTLITDPFSDDFGLKSARSMQANMVAQSHKGGYADNVGMVTASEGKRLFEVTHAGEYETGKIFVSGIHVPTKKFSQHTIYQAFFEEISVGFLGVLDRKLTDHEIEELGEIDILMLPVGGEDVLSPSDAADVVAQVEPRVVIPYHYHIDKLKTGHGTVESFVKSIGVSPRKEQKLKISKSALPEEDVELVILEA